MLRRFRRRVLHGARALHTFSCAVSADDAGMRVDRWISRNVSLHGRTVTHGLLRKWERQRRLFIRRGVDASSATCGDRLQTGDILEVRDIPTPLSIWNGQTASEINIKDDDLASAANIASVEVLLELDDVLVVHKPSGMASQPCLGRGDLQSALRQLGEHHARVVHRLDVEVRPKAIHTSLFCINRSPLYPSYVRFLD